MKPALTVLLSPAEYSGLANQPVPGACVVFDIFRATTTMLTALHHGARAILPVCEISEAIAEKKRDENVLLAGERDGVRIGAGLTGGIEFDFGNSPREFTREHIAGRSIVMTTTNGTRALRAAAGAQAVFAAGFINLDAQVRWIRSAQPDSLFVICAGTGQDTASEDALAAGALCVEIADLYPRDCWNDAARIVSAFYQSAGADLLGTAIQGRNGRRLLGIPELAGDVPFCLTRNWTSVLAQMDGGVIRRNDPNVA